MTISHIKVRVQDVSAPSVAPDQASAQTESQLVIRVLSLRQVSLVPKEVEILADRLRKEIAEIPEFPDELSDYEGLQAKAYATWQSLKKWRNAPVRLVAEKHVISDQREIYKFKLIEKPDTSCRLFVSDGNWEVPIGDQPVVLHGQFFPSTLKLRLKTKAFFPGLWKISSTAEFALPASEERKNFQVQFKHTGEVRPGLSDVVGETHLEIYWVDCIAPKFPINTNVSYVAKQPEYWRMPEFAAESPVGHGPSGGNFSDSMRLGFLQARASGRARGRAPGFEREAGREEETRPVAVDNERFLVKSQATQVKELLGRVSGNSGTHAAGTVAEGRVVVREWTSEELRRSFRSSVDAIGNFLTPARSLRPSETRITTALAAASLRLHLQIIRASEMPVSVLGFGEAFLETRLVGVYANDRKSLSKKIPSEPKLEFHEHVEFDISDSSSLTGDEWARKLEFARLEFAAFVEERSTGVTRLVGRAQLALAAILRAKRETVTLALDATPAIFGLKFPAFTATSSSQASVTVQASFEPAVEFPHSQIPLISGRETKELLAHVAAFMEKHGKAAAVRLFFPVDASGSSFLVNRVLYPMRAPSDAIGNLSEFVATFPSFAAFREEGAAPARGEGSSGNASLLWKEFLEIGAGDAHAVLLCNLLNAQDASSYAEASGKTFLAAIDRFGEPQLAVLRVPTRSEFAELHFPATGDFVKLRVNREVDASVMIHALADLDNIYVNSEADRVLRYDAWPALFSSHDKFRFFRDGVMDKTGEELTLQRNFPETSDLRALADRVSSKLEFAIRDHRSAENPNSLTRVNQVFKPALLEILAACEDARWGNTSGDAVVSALNNFQSSVAYGRVVVGRPLKSKLVDYGEIWAKTRDSLITSVPNDRTEFGVAVLVAERAGVFTVWSIVVAVLPKDLY